MVKFVENDVKSFTLVYPYEIILFHVLNQQR